MPRPRGLYKYKLGVSIQETEFIKVTTVTQIIPFVNIKKMKIDHELFLNIGYVDYSSRY